jgi:hypothetical protein
MYKNGVISILKLLSIAPSVNNELFDKIKFLNGRIEELVPGGRSCQYKMKNSVSATITNMIHLKKYLFF